LRGILWRALRALWLRVVHCARPSVGWVKEVRCCGGIFAYEYARSPGPTVRAFAKRRGPWMWGSEGAAGLGE
jgi:hypothetical protein